MKINKKWYPKFTFVKKRIKVRIWKIFTLQIREILNQLAEHFFKSYLKENASHWWNNNYLLSSHSKLELYRRPLCDSKWRCSRENKKRWTILPKRISKGFKDRVMNFHVNTWLDYCAYFFDFNSTGTFVPSGDIQCLNGCTLNKGLWGRGGNLRRRILPAFLWTISSGVHPFLKFRNFS